MNMIRASSHAKLGTTRLAAALSGGIRFSDKKRCSRLFVGWRGEKHLLATTRHNSGKGLHSTSGIAAVQRHARANTTSTRRHRQQEPVLATGGATAVNKVNARTNVLECSLTEGILYIAYNVHSTPEVPGNGGLRIGTYPSPGAAQDEAVALTEAMSAKHAMYDTGFTGAKLVFDSDVPIKSLCKDTLMNEVATSLGAMNGAVYTGCDMNTTHKVRGDEGAERREALFPHPPLDPDSSHAHKRIHGRVPLFACRCFRS